MLTSFVHSTAGSTSDCRYRGCMFKSHLGHVTSVEIDHELIIDIFLSLIQKGQLLVTDESMYTKYWLKV